MKRLTLEPRPDWQRKVEHLGLAFHTGEEPYWEESACYCFTAGEIDLLEAATNELHRLCLLAVQHIIDHALWEKFGIPEPYRALILNSWEREDLSLYGRFDLWFNGRNPPRLYEYNADTPTSLLEASVIQWDWLRERWAEHDQFNSVHEKLIARWRESGDENKVTHFACVRDHLEDLATTVYLEDTAQQAGLATKRLYIHEIGWLRGRFVDREERPITRLFKLYPWEWLIDESFSRHLLGEPWQLIEPAWKMLLSNKAILPLLWELFPGHPNLLPAYFSPELLGSTYIKKPALGREGAGVAIVSNGQLASQSAPAEVPEERCIYQAFLPPPCFSGSYPVIGSWIVRDEAAGIGIRESRGLITQNTSRFVPHFFEPRST